MNEEIHDDLLPIEGPGRDELLALYQMDIEKAVLSGMISKWDIAQKLFAIGKYYLRTHDKRSILMGLRFCCMRGFSIPQWCTGAFLNDCYNKVYGDYETNSWDDVFGRPFPKGTKLAPKKEAREKRWAVYKRICELKNLDPDLLP